MKDEDSYYLQVDNQLLSLQDHLKERLMETNEITDINQNLFKSTLKLKERTSILEATSNKTKWKWLLKNIKWIVIGCSVGLIIIFIIYKITAK